MSRVRFLLVTFAVVAALLAAGAPSAHAGAARATWRAVSRTPTVSDVVTVTMPDSVLANQTVSASMTSSVTDTPTSCDQPDRQPAPPPESVAMPGRVQFVLNGVVRGVASLSTPLTGTRTYNTSCRLGT